MTKCTNPPPLTDDDLSLVLDGLADEAIHQHLEGCSWCASRLEAMRRFDYRLVGRLRRFECPAPQHLADYHAGMLDADEAEAVRAHVATCPRCQQDLATLDQFLNLPPEEESTPNYIIPLWTPHNVWKATRVQVSGSLALKGADDETTHDIKAGSASVFLESKAVPKGFLLTGQVLDKQVDWVGAVAEIRLDGSPLGTSLLDDNCEFSFDFATPTTIDLFITSASGVTLAVENVTIQS